MVFSTTFFTIPLWSICCLIDLRVFFLLGKKWWDVISFFMRIKTKVINMFSRYSAHQQQQQRGSRGYPGQPGSRGFRTGAPNWSFVFDPAGRLCYYWSMVVSLAFLYNFWVIIYRFAFQEINGQSLAYLCHVPRSRSESIQWIPDQLYRE